MFYDNFSKSNYKEEDDKSQDKIVMDEKDLNFENNEEGDDFSDSNEEEPGLLKKTLDFLRNKPHRALELLCFVAAIIFFIVRGGF